jgi:hypothetical protein
MSRILRGLAAAALACLAVPLGAQPRALQLSAQAGFTAADDAYQSNCGHTSLAFGVDVQGRGRLFPIASLDHHVGAGGGDVLCIPMSTPGASAIGGLRLEGSTRVGLGAGARLGRGALQFEGALLAGAVTGRPGFDAPARDGGRRVLPQVGGQLSLVLARWVVLSVETHWTRLTLDVTPAGGGAVASQSSWSPMTTAQAGLRVPLGRQ